MNMQTAVENTTVLLPLFRRKTMFKDDDFLKAQSYIIQQKHYHRWKSTPPSERIALDPQIDIRHKFKIDPANPLEKQAIQKFEKTCLIKGFVTDITLDERTRQPNKICLSLVYVKNKLEDDWTYMDSHVWLFVNKLFKAEYPIFMGSFITISAVTNKYKKPDKDGNIIESRGIKEWTILSSDFLYFAKPKNTYILKKYPCEKIKKARCCIFQPNANKSGYLRKEWKSMFQTLMTTKLFWEKLSLGKYFFTATMEEIVNL